MAVTGVMVMGRRGGATPHPATEPSAASSRFYAAGIAETVHLDTGDVRIFARRASHATMAKAREVTSPAAVPQYPTLAKECRLARALTRRAVVLMRCCVPRLSKSARSQTDRT